MTIIIKDVYSTCLKRQSAKCKKRARKPKKKSAEGNFLQRTCYNGVSFTSFKLHHLGYLQEVVI